MSSIIEDNQRQQHMALKVKVWLSIDGFDHVWVNQIVGNLPAFLIFYSKQSLIHV